MNTHFNNERVCDSIYGCTFEYGYDDKNFIECLSLPHWSSIPNAEKKLIKTLAISALVTFVGLNFFGTLPPNLLESAQAFYASYLGYTRPPSLSVINTLFQLEISICASCVISSIKYAFYDRLKQNAALARYSQEKPSGCFHTNYLALRGYHENSPTVKEIGGIKSIRNASKEW